MDSGSEIGSDTPLSQSTACQSSSPLVPPISRSILAADPFSRSSHHVSEIIFPSAHFNPGCALPSFSTMSDIFSEISSSVIFEASSTVLTPSISKIIFEFFLTVSFDTASLDCVPLFIIALLKYLFVSGSAISISTAPPPAD